MSQPSGPYGGPGPQDYQQQPAQPPQPAYSGQSPYPPQYQQDYQQQYPQQYQQSPPQQQQYPQQYQQYPQQQPVWDGQQQYPQQQPAWNGQQQPAPDQSAPRPPKKGNKVLRNVLIGVVALAVVLVVGINLLLHDATKSLDSGGATGANNSMTAKWAIMGTKGTTGITTLTGSWITPNTVVDGREDGLIAYSIATGTQEWSFQTPTGDVGCAMSDSVSSDGTAVFAYGEDANNCDKLVAVNVDSGKQLWSQPINLANSSSGGIIPIQVKDPLISISGDTLAVEGHNDSLAAYDLQSGKELWQTQTGDGINSPQCNVEATAALSSTVYGLFDCSDYSNSSNPDYQSLVGYNAQTGAKTWTGTLPSGVTLDSAASLWTDAGYMFLIYDKTAVAYNGTGTSGVSLDLSSYDIDSFSGNSQMGGQMLAHGMAIYGHVLYIEGAVSNYATNNANAVDLSTGKTLWTQNVQNTGVTLIKADASGVHGVIDTTGTGDYRIVNYAAANGAMTYGNGTTDKRVSFLSQDMSYLVGNYLIDLPAVAGPSMPEIVVMQGTGLS